MNTSPMNFDSIDLVEVPVTICKKDYVIVQANSRVGELYRTKAAQCAKSRMTDGELVGMDLEGAGSVQPYLVSLMLKEVGEDGARVSVPIGTINCWPDHIIRALYDRCREVSPSLVETPTKDVLLKQRASIERQLAKIDGPPAEELAKN